MMYSENLQTNEGKTKGRFIKGFISGAIAMAIIFTITVNMIAMAIIFTITVNMIFPLLDQYGYHPALRTVECPLSFTDIYGLTIDKNANDQWELTADQDVLVWLDLPSNIDQLRADIKSSYPYEVKAGEENTITVEVYCYSNYTKYVGTLDFVAADDLTIGAVCHGNNFRNSSIGVNNDTIRNFSWMEAGKHAYVHYPLYTSCAGEYNVYQICGGQSSVGYNVDFDIIALGAPEMLYVSSRPDGNVENETNARLAYDRMQRLEKITQSENRQQEIKDQIAELEQMLEEEIAANSQNDNIYSKDAGKMYHGTVGGGGNRED